MKDGISYLKNWRADMINRTDGWKCSNGKCFSSKREAYSEEIIHLYQTIPVVGNRKNTAGDFNRLVIDMTSWLVKAQGLQKQMRDEPDVETARDLSGQGV